MTNIEVNDSFKKKHEEMESEWEIADFFTVASKGKKVICPIFYFVDIPWRFQILFISIMESVFINLQLVQLEHISRTLDCSVEYCFGLKKVDGSVSAEHFSKGILTVSSENFTEKGILDRYTKSLNWKLSEIQQQKSELLPSDMLTVTCMLKKETTDYHQVKMLTPAKTFMKLETLSENFKSLLLNKESCDTTLFVKDKEYKAHRAVLMARSSVFGAMFQHETSEKQTGIVYIPDCDPESFGEFLEFLYTGKLEQPSPQSALHLYETSEKYNIQELKTLCSEFLMENWTIEILCDAATVADKYDDAELLFAVQCFFTKNLSNILVTPQWESFLKNNHRLANKLLIAMSSKVKAVD